MQVLTVDTKTPKNHGGLHDISTPGHGVSAGSQNNQGPLKILVASFLDVCRFHNLGVRPWVTFFDPSLCVNLQREASKVCSPFEFGSNAFPDSFLRFLPRLLLQVDVQGDVR
jgi:hypothetical protein